jgi:hypothetical protein
MFVSTFGFEFASTGTPEVGASLWRMTAIRVVIAVGEIVGIDKAHRAILKLVDLVIIPGFRSMSESTV